jgi:hypothetical protein
MDSLISLSDALIRLRAPSLGFNVITRWLRFSVLWLFLIVALMHRLVLPSVFSLPMKTKIVFLVYIFRTYVPRLKDKWQ